MSVALLVLAAVQVVLLVAVAVEVALFLRRRHNGFEQLLLAVEEEARSVRLAISGHASPEARDRFAVLERLRIEE